MGRHPYSHELALCYQDKTKRRGEMVERKWAAAVEENVVLPFAVPRMLPKDIGGIVEAS